MNWKKIVLIVAILAIVGGLTYYLVRISKQSKEQAEIKRLQKFSEEAGKDKFDLSGKVVKVDVANKKITVNITDASKTIESHQGKNTILAINEKARITKTGNEIKLSDIKAGQEVSIQGSFSGDNLSAEMITVK